jgi:hypothetical protein
MELKSFKEILLKKAEGNPYLQTLIKYAKDELIAEEIIESLLKMAEPSAAMGRGANSALTSFAGNMGKTDVAQMRDALGHHISHYRSALNAHHAATDSATKAKLRGVADQHLNNIIPLMHLAGRAGKHSGGKMTLDYVGTTPWESNYTTTERHPHNGKLKEGTKDLGRRISPNASREKNPRAVPDYRYLEMPPHSEHPSTSKSPHKGGYPFEEIQLGSPEDRDAGKAYLNLEDVPNKQEYTPHPFDKHPIHSVADSAEHHLDSEQKDKFVESLKNWQSSEPHKNWMASQKEAFQKDPEAYKARGSKKPGHQFGGIPLLDQPGSVRNETQPTSSQAPEDAKYEAEVNDFDRRPPSERRGLAGEEPKVSAKEVKSNKADKESSDFYTWWNKMSPADQQGLLKTPMGSHIRAQLANKPKGGK